MVYSHDLRKKALDYVEKGNSKKCKSHFRSNDSHLIYNWGCLEPAKTRQKKPYKIDEEKLKCN